jgi:signal transduction histidine kinase
MSFQNEKGEWRVAEVNMDIRERKRLEEELRQSGERYRAVIDVMSNCVAVYKAVEDGRDFVFLEFNRTAERTEKAKAEEVIGKKITEVFPEVRESGLLDVLQRVYATGKAERFPATLYKDNRIERERNNFVYKLPSGEVVAVYEDVTERKKAEESERENREKVAHLDRLKSLGTMVSGIGHEINNPNNFILMNTTLLREIWDDAKKILASSSEKKSGNTKLGGLPFDKAMETFPQLIDDMRQGSVRIKEIVANLRDFAVKNQSSLMETVNLKDIILSSESLTRNLIQKSSNRFTLDIGDVPMVLGNFQKLEQVIVNLITNACHSLTDPGQAIEIKVFCDKDKGMVYVVVRDEGAGMDPETLKRVMEPFFTTKQHSGGTGLGSSISHGIIQEHGGSMEYASEPGKGTAVTVEVPILK